jgi:hypothetical protein
MKTLDNPVEALMAVGKENSELHEEVFRLQSEVDRYRNALFIIADHPSEAGEIAKAALANKRVN